MAHKFLASITLNSLGDVLHGIFAQVTMADIGDVPVSVFYGGTGLNASGAANGSLLIGNGSALTLATLTAGSGVTITNGVGTITIAATGTGTVTSVNLTAPAAGITVSGGPITTSGSITLALANDLAALEAMSGTGLVARTAAETYAQRTITGTANRLTVTNGGGVAGDPTLDISASYVGQASITTLGTVTTGTWSATIIAAAKGGTGLDTSAAANGKILIGNGSGLTLATLTAGSGITITNGAGSISIAASGGGGGMAIGDPVTSGTSGAILFVDGSGNLAQDPTYLFYAVGSRSLQLSNGTSSAILPTGSEAGSFTQSPYTVSLASASAAVTAQDGGGHTVQLCTGTVAISYTIAGGSSGNWNGTSGPPVDVWIALDRIAAALTTLGLSP